MIQESGEKKNTYIEVVDFIFAFTGSSCDWIDTKSIILPHSRSVEEDNDKLKPSFVA